MAMISFGDLAQSFNLRRHNADLKALTTRLSTEVTTGLAQDPGKHLNGDLNGIAGIDSVLSRLDAYKRVASDAAFFSGAMQSALSAVDDVTVELVPSMLSVVSIGNTQAISTVSREASRAFGTVVGLYNTRVGDRALFAGDETATTPLAPPESLLLQMELAVAGVTTATDLETALDAWFAAPTGFMATGYLGGNAPPAVGIGPAETVQIDITAADPAIQATLKGLAMTALLDRGLFSGDPAAQAATVRRSGEVLAGGQQSRAQLAGRLGTAEGQIEGARVRNEAEQSSLQIARNGLLAIDPFDSAARLQEAQGQLEMLYTLTARLSRLSLADYLR